jgi:hypothetical protein
MSKTKSLFDLKEELISAALDCGLTEKDIKLIDKNLKKGIHYNVDYGAYDDVEEVPKVKVSKKKIAKGA